MSDLFYPQAQADSVSGPHTLADLVSARITCDGITDKKRIILQSIRNLRLQTKFFHDLIYDRLVVDNDSAFSCNPDSIVTRAFT